MGTVYLAGQVRPVERRVALKVIRSDVLDRQTRLRFDAERIALARLSHPCIAQLYEAGETEDGSPYFAMEVVTGTPITTYCDEGRLDLRQRLELFRGVCEGVGHAHHKAILHRDLKPQNIMVTEVDGRPRPKIIDFGIAKAMDQPLVEATLMTQHGMIGTPAYMSPEGVVDSSVVDTRSDVYSLGVLLYELLVGVRPHGRKDDGPLQTIRRILEEEPARPRSKWRSLEPETRQAAAAQRQRADAVLERELRGDLEWIVMKAIAKEPDRRYDTASELAADIGRFLNNEPIEARPVSSAYQLKKFAQRHRGLVVSATLIVGLLIAGVFGTSIGLLRARSEAAAARRAENEAAEVADFVMTMFDQIDPLDAANLGGPRGEGVTALNLLDSGADRARTELQDEPEVQARIFQTLGRVYSSLDSPDKAQPLLEESVAINERLHGPLHVDTIRSQRDLGRLLENMGDYDGAARLYEASMASALTLLGERNPETIRSTQFAAKLLLTRGDVDRARHMLIRNVEIARQVLGDRHPVVADGINALAWSDYSQGDLAEAESRFREVVRYGLDRTEDPEATGVAGAGSPSVAIALNNLAWVLAVQDKIGEAEETIDSALAIMRRTLPPDHWRIANAESILGSIRARQGRFAEAEKLLTESLPVVRESTGEGSPYTRVLLERLADLSQRMGEPIKEQAIRHRWREAGGLGTAPKK
jgi:non-specific serine/threonine protein kinase/serine/threonine-protein kinase